MVILVIFSLTSSCVIRMEAILASRTYAMYNDDFFLPVYDFRRHASSVT